MYNSSIFCARLREARINASLTQRELAAEMGILQPAYNRFECGKFELSFEQLYFICRRLNVSADYLLGLCDY